MNITYQKIFCCCGVSANGHCSPQSDAAVLGGKENSSCSVFKMALHKKYEEWDEVKRIYAPNGKMTHDMR